MRSHATTRSLSRFAPVLLLLLAACASGRREDAAVLADLEKAARDAARPQTRTAVLIAVNDVYRIEGVEGGQVGGLARLRSLRAELEEEHPDLLLLHGGDFLFPSFASRLYKGAQMVDVLNALDGNAGADDDRMIAVVGNHEFEDRKLADAARLDQRIEASQFRWLAGNVVFARGGDGQPLVADDKLGSTAVVESGGIRIGVFGVTIPTPNVEYVERFDDPIARARALTAELRSQGAELVVGLTHLNAADDRRLLQELGAQGPDLIIGGHDHERMAAQVNGRWLLKADADARTATVARLTLDEDGKLDVRAEHRPLAGDAPAPDPDVQALVERWQTQHEEEFCRSKNAGPTCLEEVYGRTRVALEAEETKIRGRETNLGDWIADRMLAEFASCGAQAAFVNSGSLRLNQDVAGNSEITRRHVEELFAYSAKLKLLRIDGATLQKVVDHAVRNWPGSGSWLQIAGFSYTHDTAGTAARDLKLLTPQGPRPVRPDETILVVTNEFLVTPPDQDGYSMLTPAQIVSGCAATDRDLKDLVVAGLRAAEPQGIAPKTEGRIRQTGQ